MVLLSTECVIWLRKQDYSDVEGSNLVDRY